MERQPIIETTVCLDATDADALARFYIGLLGFIPGDNDPDDGWWHLDPPEASALVPITIQPVPEGKAVKNRLHLDLFVSDIDTWIAHAESLGAKRLDHTDTYQVMADPEGNEFCFCRR